MNNPLQCDRCGKVCTRKVALIAHRKSPCTVPKITCASCSKEFPNQARLDRHRTKCKERQPKDFDEALELIRQLREETKVYKQKLAEANKGPIFNITQNIVNVNNFHCNDIDLFDALPLEARSIPGRDLFGLVVQALWFNPQSPRNNSIWLLSETPPRVEFMDTKRKRTNTPEEFHSFFERVLKVVRTKTAPYEDSWVKEGPWHVRKRAEFFMRDFQFSDERHEDQLSSFIRVASTGCTELTDIALQR